VPSIGSRGSPSVYDSPRGGDRGSPWGGQPPPPGGYGQPEPPRGGGGGGFLRGAVSTAAGVAGGMLLANTFRDMLGGGSGHAHAAGSSETKSGEHSPYEVNADSNKKDNQAQHASYQDENDNDPGNYDADDSSDDSDDGGVDDTEV
jgi:hypothetical protein